MQRRIELLLAAIYGRPISIAGVARKKASWASRVVRFVWRNDGGSEPTPEVREDGIHLPALLSARDGTDAAVARFRLLAVEQAERLTRGTATIAPSGDPLERDLFLLRESAAIDAKIARVLPRMHDSLADERRAALAGRPRLDALTPQEREVERLLRAVLASPPEANESVANVPAESLAWAREMAATIRRERGRYRGIPPTRLWGTVPPASDDGTPDPDASQNDPAARAKSMFSASTVGGAKGVETDDGQERVADGTSRDGDDSPESPDEPGESTESSPVEGQQDDSSRMVQNKDAPATPSETKGSTRQTGAPFVPERESSAEPSFPYDEWDADARRYRRRAAVVRLVTPQETDAQLPAGVLHEHAALVRQIRHRFEKLRARRMLLDRQRAGNELDLAACVDAIVDRRTGRPPDDRLYLDARPARRGFAISLLVDVSGSTEARVHGQVKIIDLERTALLLASEALDALGDLYSIAAFTGKGPSKVLLTPVKSFEEHNDAATRRRIAALKARGFTRLGAAVRHMTHELARQTAGHRLLLIISDGRPN
ncbi:MAG: nitric oxide reductase activation protein NorD, partial [Gemmatimonadaceae bacterium]